MTSSKNPLPSGHPRPRSRGDVPSLSSMSMEDANTLRLGGSISSTAHQQGAFSDEIGSRAEGPVGTEARQPPRVWPGLASHGVASATRYLGRVAGSLGGSG
jgi:hypothetical protein